MSEKERKERIERMSAKYMGLDESNKSFITGYLIGKEEEHQSRKEKTLAEAQT